MKGEGTKGPYKYPRAQTFYSQLQGSHSTNELADLFLAGLEFPNMELIKMETQHLVVRMGDLMARLEEHYPSG